MGTPASWTAPAPWRFAADPPPSHVQHRRVDYALDWSLVLPNMGSENYAKKHWTPPENSDSVACERVESGWRTVALASFGQGVVYYWMPNEIGRVRTHKQRQSVSRWVEEARLPSRGRSSLWQDLNTGKT
jgi:hypothetical protein